ncbi:hypothetical protein GGTG_02864 [Gaeumannomyces tritici R3-111a-1]|uniref:Uncharacterized protein n=1 Tax=Gaeumannomyces tritici (strain R3-111a-1) TaxID=644352 RepID=J3NNK7_GAET3|nr:hypothetical protein GGTG_02864 [Gaeumannomyces tritici R3-111a-1]EJT77759.1 hypothetical protein GGTG_02864 [Gaeumannomyces tritici R3-111a-1]
MRLFGFGGLKIGCWSRKAVLGPGCYTDVVWFVPSLVRSAGDVQLLLSAPATDLGTSLATRLGDWHPPARGTACARSLVTCLSPLPTHPSLTILYQRIPTLGRDGGPCRGGRAKLSHLEMAKIARYIAEVPCAYRLILDRYGKGGAGRGSKCAGCAGCEVRHLRCLGSGKPVQRSLPALTVSLVSLAAEARPAGYRSYWVHGFIDSLA